MLFPYVAASIYYRAQERFHLVATCTPPEATDIEHTADTHSSSRPEAGQAVAIPSSLLETPDEMVGHPVSASEVSFFKENGYLVKRGLLKRASLQPAVDYVWDRAPSCVSRHDPSSYTHAHRLWDRTAVNGEGGGDQNHWSGARGDNGLWQLLSSGPTGLGTEPFMLRLVPNSAEVQAVVAALMGFARPPEPAHAWSLRQVPNTAPLPAHPKRHTLGLMLPPARRDGAA